MSIESAMTPEQPQAVQRWVCFHCDFATSSIAEAAAHFGDRDDAEEFKPICKWWTSMDAGEKIGALQDTIQQLNAEREELGNLQLALAAKDTEIAALQGKLAMLNDPAIVHTNILRGTIALTRGQAIHIAGLPADIEEELATARRDALEWKGKYEATLRAWALKQI